MDTRPRLTILIIAVLALLGTVALLFTTRFGIGTSPIIVGDLVVLPNEQEDPDPLSAARWLNAVLFGANILLIGLILVQVTDNSFWLPVIGSFLVLTSGSMLTNHSMAWTEPLFIFLARKI